MHECVTAPVACCHVSASGITMHAWKQGQTIAETQLLFPQWLIAHHLVPRRHISMRTQNESKEIEDATCKSIIEENESFAQACNGFEKQDKRLVPPRKPRSQKEETASGNQSLPQLQCRLWHPLPFPR